MNSPFRIVPVLRINLVAIVIATTMSLSMPSASGKDEVLSVEPSRVTNHVGLVQKRKSCTPVDLHDRQGLGSVRNQGSSYWCFAFAAADFVSTRLGKKVSAVDIAISAHGRPPGESFFNFLWNKKSGALFQGVDLEESLHRSQKKGFCLEENFRSDESGQKSFIGLLKFLHNPKTAELFTNPVDLRSVYREARAIAPKMSESQFIHIFRNPDRESFFERFREAACEPRMKTDLGFHRVDPKNLAAGIRQELDYSMPPLIDYDVSCALGSGRDAWHASVIVGREFDAEKRQCKYLIRNTWGTDNTGSNAPAGHFWITESLLKKCVRLAQSNISPRSGPRHAPVRSIEKKIGRR